MIEISIKIKMVFSSKEELKNDSAKFYIKKLAYIHTQSVHLVNVIYIYICGGTPYEFYKSNSDLQ